MYYIMKFKFPSKITTNVYFLYIVAILAILNIFGFLTTGNTTGVIIFLVSGLATFVFNKNMAIVLSVATVVSILFSTSNLIKEGLDNPTSEGGETAATTSSSDGGDAATTATTTAQTAGAATTATATAATGATGAGATTATTTPPATASEGFAEYQEGDAGAGKSKGPRIDYASTLEDAYKSLNDMIGPDGVKGLTKDTSLLMDQQKKLFDTIANLTPILEKAQNFLGKNSPLTGDQSSGPAPNAAVIPE